MLETIRTLAIIVALMGIFLLVLALLISQADSIIAFGKYLGIPSYRDSVVNQP
jgi:hypothetical protein